MGADSLARRLGARARAVPPPLAALVGAVLVVGWAWALLVPPGQTPDEPVHVAYVQTLAERGERPKPGSRGGERDVFSTEQKLARRFSNYEAPVAEPSVRPEWRRSSFQRWRREQRRLSPSDRRDGGVENAAAGNPPLYYVWEAVAYRAAAGGDLFTRWYAMRMWSVVLLAVATVATWLLAGEVVGRDRVAQLVASAFVGLHPGASAISAAINPDAAMIAVWALVLWLGVRLLRRGAAVRGALALAAATVAALLTKATSFALLPALAVVVALGAGRLGTRRLAVGAVAGAAALGVVLLAGAADRLVGALSRGEAGPWGFASYLWQAYLPNLPFQTPVRNLPAFWGYDVWIRSGWGNFGWAELLLPGGAYAAVAVACLAIFAGAAAAVARGRFPVERGPAAFLAVAAGALVLGLHWGEYNQFLDIGVSLLQGRYLLPLLPIGGLAAAAALANLPRARRGMGAALLLVGLFALQVFSLGIVVGRFYA